MRNSIFLGLLGAAVLSACGPAGVISGTVSVEGGSAGGIAVIVYGPQSGATVTGDDGKYNIGNLPDGKYVVRATVRGADVEELSVATTVTQGKASPEPILAFRASTAKITGHVVMSDGSGAENLTVTAVGPETASVRTTAGGAFAFDGLKTGAYTVSVEAPETLEGHVGVGVNASGLIDAGDLRLTPVGRFGGTVMYNAMPVSGAPVVVGGTSSSAVTDAMGKFQLINVPTGAQSVRVRVGTAPFFRSATAMVTVARGANADLALSLTDDPAKTGTVTGTVTFHGPRNPQTITVSAPGSGVTATPQLNGSYLLTLPVGTWDVVANAPQHPTKLLGRVTVVEGSAQSLPGAEVTWFRPIWRSGSILSSISTPTSSALANETVPWSLVSFSEGPFPRLALMNSITYDFRILAAGTTSGHRLSKTGKYVGWYVLGTVFVYEIATATLSTYSATTNANGLEFSTDESALFIRRGQTLTRIKFSAPNNPEIFPPSGLAAGIFSQSVDRWFVLDSVNDVRLVTPVTDVAQVFTQVQQFSVTPTAWAMTNCGVTCTLRVLSPTSNSTSVADTSVAPAPGAITNFSNFGLDNRGDYPCFGNAGNAFCVRSMDGTHLALPAFPQSFRLNEAGDRVIWTLPTGGNRAVREEPMPPTSSTNLGSNLVGWSIGWLSPTRAFAYEVSGAPRQLHLVKGGIDTADTDVGAQNVVAAPPLLLVPQGTTSRWRGYLGDGPVRLIDVPTSSPVTSYSVRPLGTGPVTKYAAVSYDPVSLWLIDETNSPSVKQNFVGFAGGFAYRSGTVEFMIIDRTGGQRAMFNFNTGVLLEFNEGGGTLTTSIGAVGVMAYVGLADDSRSIILAGFQP